MALSGLKPVVVQVKPILTFHPSGAAENVQNRFPTHVKNFACGLGFMLSPDKGDIITEQRQGDFIALTFDRLYSKIQ